MGGPVKGSDFPTDSALNDLYVLCTFVTTHPVYLHKSKALAMHPPAHLHNLTNSRQPVLLDYPSCAAFPCCGIADSSTSGNAAEHVAVTFMQACFGQQYSSDNSTGVTMP